MSHELCRAFAEADLPLKQKLAEMLDEHFSHHTERRGCGYTQATRLLAEHINLPRSQIEVRDLGLFDDDHTRGVEQLATAALAAGWQGGWRQLDQAPESIRARLADSKPLQFVSRLASTLAHVGKQLQHEESRIVHALISDLLAMDASQHSNQRLPSMAEKPDIGSCSAAEEYFLEIAHGRVRRGGQANIIVAADNCPLLVEKVNLGESHSALSVRDIVMNGVHLPAGSLFALQRSQPAPNRTIPCGQVLPLSCIEQARFLRLTTLAVEPELRARAFSQQLAAQVRNAMFSPLSTRLDHLRSFIDTMLTA